MGLEFKLETYDAKLRDLPTFLRHLPEFLNEDRLVNLTIDGTTVAVSVSITGSFVYIVQHVSCRGTDALLGLIIRRVLSLNERVVISEV